MVQGGGLANAGINPSLQFGTVVDRALQHFTVVQVRMTGLGGISHFKAHAIGIEVTGVADLPARFSIKRRLIQNHYAAIAFT